MSAPKVRQPSEASLTPRQQREARALVAWYLKSDCRIASTGKCFWDDKGHNRWHDRARLFLRQTAPKPARRKKA